MTKILRALALLLTLAVPLAADPAPVPLPSGGFNGDRYVQLWTKSPFAIATPEASPTSQDYELVGLAQFDGVSYASLVAKQTQEHFVLTTQKPEKGLTLVSVRHDGQGGSAVVERNGETLVLQETAAPAAPALANMNGFNPTPGGFPGMGSNPAVGGVMQPTYPPPRVRIHRPLIVIPPPPANP